MLAKTVIILEKVVQILELTVPLNTKNGLQTAREKIQTKPNYIARINYFEATGFTAKLDTLEAGSLGHIEKEAIATFHAIFPNLMKSMISHLLLELSKIAVDCSSPASSMQEMQLGT